jgi:hypothetical protein
VSKTIGRHFIGGSDIARSRTFQELQAAAPFSQLAASLKSNGPAQSIRRAFFMKLKSLQDPAGNDFSKPFSRE